MALFTHRFRVGFRGVHALAHHRRELGLCLRSRIALGNERLHGTGELLKTGIEIVVQG